MEKRPPHIRFFVMKYDNEPYWSVIDIFTGKPHVLKGVVLNRFEAEEADEMVDLLNLQDMKTRAS
ncbi:hypothetical protein C9413_27010 [Rhizobium sp. SEMIA 4085]|uniref:Uncharacterized protein n=1 Tax=Rhizobium gallicum bv. gallicum R602sp TaxID=1041138 RepID=A0A0B4X3H0_9HYPH|nr:MULTISPECIES: hypothetical protein [Rhizobium]AJD41067.1 hypothetical protein RGR602_CH01728 [Rhizobium gallicum bv. gallicum R602sp]NNH32952.1 hypothetical protein [Rhizobium sp. SEMIA 4085]TDW34919.1 hypothetical protein EV128_103198 [Rhizobium azibense]